MIDIDLIHRDLAQVRHGLEKRGSAHVDLDGIVDLDKQRRQMTTDVERLRRNRNEIAAQIGDLRARSLPADEQQAAAGALKRDIAVLEARLAEAKNKLDAMLAELPNIPDARVPAGGKDQNSIVRTWGECSNIEDPLDHVELSMRLGLIDYSRGAKLAGTGSWIYTDRGAALEWALLDFFCREHFAAGYTFMLPPHLLLDHCGFAAGQFPKFWDDVFHVSGDDPQRGRFLIPTAETAILSVYAGEILDEAKLPIKAFAFSPCYRHEAGAYRSDERGTIRGHQFNKVEMFQFVAPEDSDGAFSELVRRAESLVEKLGLHYRTSLLAAGDMSASMAMTCDVEVWLPSIQKYKEVSSVSCAGEYQARRANIKYRGKASKGTRYIHTLNGSGLATSRLLPAILEQNQQSDGSVLIPQPLQAWLKTDRIVPEE
jgi:seryl-tRNA synthetase